MTMMRIFEAWAPITYQAFLDFRLNRTELSHKAIVVVQAWLRGERVEQSDSGLSKREWNELIAQFSATQGSA